MHLWIPVELSFGRNLHNIFYCLCRKSNNHVMEMWVHVFIASWCTQIYFAYHCHFDIEDYSYFYIWFFSYFYMRQHIYASNAMKNIYYHLFISDDEGGEDKDCSQDNFFYFIRVLNIIVVLHISHEEHKKYWICMLNAKNSLRLFTIFMICHIFKYVACIFIVLLPFSLSTSRLLKLLKIFSIKENCCRFEYFWLSFWMFEYFSEIVSPHKKLNCK